MERRILFFTCAAHAFTHVYMVIYSVVLGDMSRDFGGDITDYATISVVLFGLGSLPSSWLGERFGEKSLLVAFFVLSAVGGIFVGLAHGWGQLAVGMACLGLGTSIFHPVGNTFMAKGIHAPGRAMGVNGLWGNFGEAVGPFFAAGVATLFSWRWAYAGLALPMLMLGLWLALTRIDLPRTHVAQAGQAPKRGLPAVVVLLLLAMMCGGFQFWIVKTMLPTYVEQNTPESLLPERLRGGALTALVYLIGGVGQVLAGRLVHHREGRGLYVLVFVLSVPFIYAVGKLSGGPLLGMASVMAILMFGAQPIENVLLARFAPPAWKGLLFGLKFTLAFGIGGLGTSLSKWVRTRYGIGEVFTAAAGFTVLAGVIAAAAYRTGRSAGGKEGAVPASITSGAGKP